MAGALKTSLQSLEAGSTGGGGDAWLEHAGDRVAAAAAAVAEGQPAAGGKPSPPPWLRAVSLRPAES